MTKPATESDLDAELDRERGHLARSRAELARMRARAQELFRTGDTVAGDGYSAETLGRTLARRIAELSDDPNTPLFFGRLDFSGATAGDRDPAEPGSSRFHIGRRHVTDAKGDPLVLDWRAPLSRTFYQASAAEPQGVSVRRRFGFHFGGLTSFEDEHLERGEELGTASRILTDEIERPRVGPMRDIVATIQPEQDELVRAELEQSICVQGAPGTGKTAVGLHRAAYLLYQYRDRLRRARVLVVGPNRAFLHYIAAVLPALGEIDVEQSTIDDLLGQVDIRSQDPPPVAALKHDPRMALVLHRALTSRITKPTDPVVVADGSYRWRLPPDLLRRVIDDVRREDLPYQLGRERVQARVVALLQRLVEGRRGESPSEAWLRRMARCAPVMAFLDRCWPAAGAPELLHGLLSHPDALADASAGLLDPGEQASLLWASPPRSARTARWSAADAVLLDEAAGLIERPAGYGHIVIDEAQDLSPMQCRALARRTDHGSITLLGDLAQGTAPWATRDWASTLAYLGKPEAPVIALNTGFRVPDVVVALANRLLPSLEVALAPARSLRHDGALAIREVTELVPAAISAVRAAQASEGSIAVIAADARSDQLTAAMGHAGIEVGDAAADRRVTVLPASLAKGLEYDHVIVVEPAEIVAAEPRGLNRLYVVLTRAVSRLDILHRLPLPAGMV